MLHICEYSLKNWVGDVNAAPGTWTQLEVNGTDIVANVCTDPTKPFGMLVRLFNINHNLVADISNKRRIHETDMYDTTQSYALHELLYVQNGKLTTKDSTDNHTAVAVGMVIRPPSSTRQTIEFFNY